MVAPFRTRAVAAVESALPGTTRPSGFGATAARPGVASTFAWWVTFYSAADEPIAGGSATVQWYGVNVETDGTVTTPEIGDAVAAAALVTKTVTVAAGIWPWPRLTAITPPVVAAKSIRVSVDDTTDGDYSITVDEETPVTYAAVGKTATEIRDALVAGFAAHPTASAVADGTIELVVTLDTAGLDFELVLEGPVEDAMSQAEETPVLPVAATVRLFLVETQAAGVDVDALVAAIAAAVPTVAEIVAAVPTAAEIAAEVDVEAGAEAAIDTKLAAIAGAVADAVPDVADIEGVVNPGVAPVELGPFVGATSYELVAAVPGNRIHVYGMYVNAGLKGCSLQPRSGATDLGGPIGIAIDDRLELAPGAFVPYVTASGEAFNIGVGDTVPSLTITIWYEVKPA